MPKQGVDARYKRLGAILREARQTKGIAQVDLAHQVKRRQAWLSKVENGESEVAVFAFLDLVDAMGVRPAAILRQLQQPST